MSFTQFVKPYPDGYEDFESGGTPVTAAILNTNYDGFLLALNDWALQTETDIGSKADTNDVGNAFAQVHGRIDSLESTVSTKSTVTIRDLLSSGTKIGTIAINGSDYDLYAPSGGGGGSSVVWNQIQQTGTKIAEVTIDGTPYDVYSPTPIDEISDLTDVSITNLQDGQILKWNSTTSKWENSNESGGGTGGHTIIDENGTSMTARTGLQFVGANVDDDATNNKTIVDLSSAGGIDGVFIDTDNVIKSTTTFTNSMSYTAIEDCVIAFYIVGKSNTDGLIKIDDEKVGGFYASGAVGFSCFYNLKNGQTITVTNAHASYTSDYTVYGIQTGTTHSKFQPVIYSTEEREIGVWEDGKPLYQKTINYSGNISQNTTTVIGTLDVGFDTIVGFIGTIREEGWASIQIPCEGFRIQIGETSPFNISFINSATLNFQPAIINLTILYTKTTDYAGSGSWTPQGIPTHKYSTEEQVIGTYFGETLYEKSWTNLNVTIVISGGNWQEISDVDLTGVAVIVDSKVWRQGGTGLVKNNNIAEMGVSPNQKLQFAYLNSNFGGTINTITLQYTKTSS